MSYLLFDIGGTNMRVAHARTMRTFEEPVIIATPLTVEGGMDALRGVTRAVTHGRPLRCAIGGIPDPRGIADPRRLPRELHWTRRPLARTLERVLGVPVLLENDSALVGLGEATVGAGRGAAIVMYLTVSTGVGGARIVDGRIDRSACGFEPGHQIVVPGGRRCVSCGARGHLQAYIAGPALRDIHGSDPVAIHSARAWRDAADVLARGLVNSIVHWSPEVVVLGGSVMERIPLRRVQTSLAEHLRKFPPPPVRRATLGSVGGLHGALALLRQYRAPLRRVTRS